MKKGARRKPRKAPRASARAARPRPFGPLLYKVVELSTVDESAIERTVNLWVQQGWNLDGVQFAMREQSKRPSMAFVFFTKEGEPATEEKPRTEDEARDALNRMAEDGEPTAKVPISAYERLRQLAEDDSAEGEQ